MILSTDSTICIIGAGAMGSGIAQVAARAGHPVLLIDSSEEALTRSRNGITGDMGKLVSRGKMSAEEKGSAEARLRWSANLEDAGEAALVVEAIVENMSAKATLFGKLANIADPDAILASNTSSLSITEMAKTVSNPARFAGLHFFNPVPVMKLVEIVPGEVTDETVVSTLLALMKSWGKAGVRVRDVPGFIVNRVARPYYVEGFAALGEGIDPVVIDWALESAGGFRMGPLALADMIGHDVNYTVARSVFDAYGGQTQFRPQAAQQALFEVGKLGRKSGSGVYDYGAALPEPCFVAPGSAPTAITVSHDYAAIAPVIALVMKSGLEITTDAALPQDSVRVDGVVAALGDGRPLHSRPDVDVLLDQARDFAKASIWVITARNSDAAKTVAALAHAIGKQLVEVPDRPGQIVLRTLAQLANAAADAVTDGVASAGDIDTAMIFGANHPEGPLTWAARTGHERVATILDNIAAATEDSMYRPAAFFRQTESAR